VIAIDKLLSALVASRWNCRPTICSGRATLNIGTIGGGRAPTSSPITRSRNHDPAGGRFANTKKAIVKAVAGCDEAREVLEIPAVRLGRWTASDNTVGHTPPTFRRWRRVGRAFSDRPGNDSRGAHARRARTQTAACQAVELSTHVNSY